MPLLKKRPAPKPVDVEDVYHSINTLAANALGHFEEAVQDLDEATHQHRTLALTVDAEIQRLVVVRNKASRSADASTEVADKIRSLVTPAPQETVLEE